MSGRDTPVALDDDADDDAYDDAYDDDVVVRPRRGRLVAGIVVPLLVVLAAFVVLLATREPAVNRIASSPLIGQAVPATAGPTLDGGSFDVDDLQGRWVLVNFFATWCGPCIQEHDDLATFAERHEAIGDAAVVSVLYSDEVDDAQRFFDERGGDWPVLVGDPVELGRVALDYGVAAVPESFLVDPNGVVIAKITGGVTDEGLERILANAQAGRPLDA